MKADMQRGVFRRDHECTLGRCDIEVVLALVDLADEIQLEAIEDVAGFARYAYRAVSGITSAHGAEHSAAIMRAAWRRRSDDRSGQPRPFDGVEQLLTIEGLDQEHRRARRRLEVFR